MEVRLCLSNFLFSILFFQLFLIVYFHRNVFYLQKIEKYQTKEK